MSLLDNDDDLVNKSDAAVEIWHIRKKEEEMRIWHFTIYDGYGSTSTENESTSTENEYPDMKYYIF